MSKRSALIKKAHAIMREIVIDRDGGCVCPPPEQGHSSILQAGHIIKSTKSGVRFDLYNVHCQCSSCNGRHVHYEHYYVDWFLKKFGETEKIRIGKDSDDGLKNYEIQEITAQLSLIREKQKENPKWKPYFMQKEILSGAWKNKDEKS